MSLRRALFVGALYFVLQSDDNWKIMKFSTYSDLIEHVIKISIQFENFPGQDVFVKDLSIRACIPKGRFYVLNFMN